MLVRRIARALAVAALGLATATLFVASLGIAVVLSTGTETGYPAPTAPAGAATYPAQTRAPASLCWTEHKPAADGGDEKVCGDVRLMPPGSTLLTTNT